MQVLGLQQLGPQPRSLHSMILTARLSTVLTKIEAHNLVVGSLLEVCGAWCGC